MYITVVIGNRFLCEDGRKKINPGWKGQGEQLQPVSIDKRVKARKTQIQSPES